MVNLGALAVGWLYDQPYFTIISNAKVEMNILNMPNVMLCGSFA
jgi:hypothetical protein